MRQLVDPLSVQENRSEASVIAKLAHPRATPSLTVREKTHQRTLDKSIERNTQAAIKVLREQVVTIRHVGFKPFMAKSAIPHINHLLKHKVIDLTKDADGVRCFMEMRAGKLSPASHAYIIRQLDERAIQEIMSRCGS